MRKPYPSDISDDQWARIAPAFLPGRGRPRQIPAREILNAILYVKRNGCSWRALPHDLPKWLTAFAQRRRWTLNSVLQTAYQLLTPAHHVPTVGIIDSTFIESAFGGADSAPSGYKRATGHSLHVAISRLGTVLAVKVLPANRPDAQGARLILPAAKRCFPSLVTILGDRAYRQQPLAEAMWAHGMTIDATSPPLPKGTLFKPLPTRWRVEQLFAWVAKWWRIAKNWCFTSPGFETDVGWAFLGLALRNKAVQKELNPVILGI